MNNILIEHLYILQDNVYDQDKCGSCDKIIMMYEQSISHVLHLMV